MEVNKLIDQIVNTWRVNDRINLRLLRHVSVKGLKAVPTGSRGQSFAGLPTFV